MAKWLILVEVNCTDPDRVNELHEWYEKSHIPDLLKVPGIVRVTRYENVTPGEVRSKLLTLLEAEADDVWQVTTALQEDSAKAEKEGRRTELLQIVAGAVYQQLSTDGAGDQKRSASS
jgi:hypothetical protein